MISSRDLTERIGTEITADIDTLLSGRFASDLRDLLFRRGVLVFKEIGLTKAQHEAFTATLGALEDQGGKASINISLDPKINGFMADYMKANFYWHIDLTVQDVPNLASCLLAQTVAPEGGETEFANTYAAWEDLPQEERSAVEGLRVVHSLEASERLAHPEPTVAELLDWRRYSPKTHPLVWTHRSRRKSLVLGASASHVEGMDFEDGRLLLARLREWATQPQYVYRHDWSVGDMVIWDNTGTMHRARPYDPLCGRLMSRTALAGEEAIA